jgi:tetratricopeptide (TPR) repeat protein
MSLLMEALRKAEQAKRSMQQEEQARGDATHEAAPAFTLEEREPETTPDVTPRYIRENFTSLEPAVATTPDAAAEQAAAAQIAPAVPASLPSRQAQQRQQRAAAASVFAAKRKPARSRRTLAILVSTLVLMLPLGGGLLWYLQQANSSSIGLNPALANYDLSSRRLEDASTPANTTVVGTANEAVPAGVVVDETGADVVEPVAATAAVAATEPEPEPAAEGISTTPPAQVAEATIATTATTATTTTTASTLQPAPVAPGANAPALALPANTQGPVLEVSRSRGTPQVNPDLVSAYARLQDGDVAGAGALYRQVLAALPNNRDALLGLASVHMREGRPANARELYARLLQLNPRDPLAHTGLLQTMQAGSPNEHENTLKQLQDQYPNVAQLTLALGNHYAAQGRWSEAQAAYYNALLTARRNASGPVHPDYAFNLAVSLEQLKQPKAALDYYRQAQLLAADVTPGFDIQLLNSRLDYLDALLLEQAPR